MNKKNRRKEINGAWVLGLGSLVGGQITNHDSRFTIHESPHHKKPNT